MYKFNNRLLRKSAIIAACAVLCLSAAACGKGGEDKENSTGSTNIDTTTVPLNEDEKELLDAVNDDIHVVTDDNYINTLVELTSHTDEFSGQIYQIEGVYTKDGDIPYISRNLVNNGEKTPLGLPLVYMTKDLPTSTWVRVTGIVNEGEVGGENQTVFEVLSIESLPEAGEAELPWNGKFEHNH